jgi:hypothetical protein
MKAIINARAFEKMGLVHRALVGGCDLRDDCGKPHSMGNIIEAYLSVYLYQRGGFINLV